MQQSKLKAALRLQHDLCIDNRPYSGYIGTEKLTANYEPRGLDGRAADCRETPVLRQAKLGFFANKGKISEIILQTGLGWVSFQSLLAYFFKFMAANLSFTQFLT